jgi:PucR family transcriptional regulator, purine catabolism regulatory protein
MSLTVRDLVTRPQLRLTVIVEGDLDRMIRWVHVSEMPDPAPYLRGDEVVLTAGIWSWHGMAPGAFAAGLGHAQAAALGFGTNPLVAEVPADLVDACRAWGLTLFHVPPDISFIEIAEEFVEAQHRLRERSLLESLERSGSFLFCLQEGGGLDGLLRILSALLPRSAAVVQRGRGVLADAGAGALVADAGATVERVLAAGGAHVNLGEMTAFPVPMPANDTCLVVAGSQELSVAERAIVDQALAFVAIELQRERAVIESERRLHSELFDLVAAGESQQPAVAARMRSLGVDPESPTCAICCAAPDPEAALLAVRSHVQSSGHVGSLAVKAGELLGFLPVADDDDLIDLARMLCRAVGAEAFVGVGGRAACAEEMGRSLVQARHACRFAMRRRDARYATHDTLASHALLIGLQDPRLLDVFRETLVRPLEEHDSRRRTDLARTLELFLGSGGRYQQTADELHLHVNTLRQRLGRIEKLTGRSLDSMDDRVDLWIALRSRTAS